MPRRRGTDAAGCGKIENEPAECDLTRLLDSLEGVVNSRLLTVVLAERESERRSGDQRNVPGIESAFQAS